MGGGAGDTGSVSAIFGSWRSGSAPQFHLLHFETAGRIRAPLPSQHTSAPRPIIHDIPSLHPPKQRHAAHVPTPHSIFDGRRGQLRHGAALLHVKQHDLRSSGGSTGGSEGGRGGSPVSNVASHTAKHCAAPLTALSPCCCLTLPFYRPPCPRSGTAACQCRRRKCCLWWAAGW